MLSAEIRWFWPGRPPAAFEPWFVEAGSFRMAAKDCGARRDRYLRPCEPAELGIKERGSAGTEIKGLVARRDHRIGFDSLAAPVEIWAKWTVCTLDLAHLPLLSVGKQRWIRRFVPLEGEMHEVPAADENRAANAAADCEVELTLLAAPDDSIWWTLGFEAHGPLAAVEATLTGTAATVESRLPPLLPPGQWASYPAWLSSRSW